MNAKAKKSPPLEAESGDCPRSAKPCMRRPYDRLRVRSIQGGESPTVQDSAGETDIKNIVNKYHRTGILPPAKPGVFADVSNLQGDLTERLIWAQQVQENAQREIAEIQQQREAAADQSGNTGDAPTIPDQTQTTQSQSTSTGQQEGPPD